MMKLFLKNHLYGVLTLSRLLNSMGSYLYNIVFVVYAATVFHSKLVVGIANITMVIPTIFTVFVGIRADKTRKKGNWLIYIGIIQAVLFTFASLIIHESTLLVFSLVCLINVISDTLSDFANGLRMPIIQNNVSQEDLVEAYSFTQFISYICSLSGQAIGIWLLTISHNNFAFVAFINGISFFLSSFVLITIKDKMTYKIIDEDNNHEKLSLKKQIIKMFNNIKMIFNDTNSGNFINLLISILLLNSLGGSITAVYNIFLLEHNLLSFTYSQSLLVVEVILVGGILLGSLTPNDYFSRLSIGKLVRINSVIFLLVAISNLFSPTPLIGILILAFATYLSGKVNPKINSLLLTNLPSNILAQTSNFLSLLFTLSIPLGTAIFSLTSSWNTNITWIIFLLIVFLTIVLSSENFFKKE